MVSQRTEQLEFLWYWFQAFLVYSEIITVPKASSNISFEKHICGVITLVITSLQCCLKCCIFMGIKITQVMETLNANTLKQIKNDLVNNVNKIPYQALLKWTRRLRRWQVCQSLQTVTSGINGVGFNITPTLPLSSSHPYSVIADLDL